MRHTFNISGMTCGNCKAAVEEALKSIDEVSSVEVDLENATVEISTFHHISLKEFQASLPPKYTISEAEKSNVFTSVSEEDTSEEKSKLQQLKPLFLIFGYIIIASALLHYKDWNTREAMLDFMGLFYVIFSFFKFLDLKGFAQTFRMYDPLAKTIPIYGWIYPFIEGALGLAFLMRFEIEIALIATLIVLGITTIGVTQTLLNKKKIRCACLGTALKLPMTEATFIENAIMILMALSMLTFI